MTKAQREALAASLTIKLGSLVVHVEELLAPGGHALDREALRGLVQDAEVQRWLATIDPVFLPLKRP